MEFGSILDIHKNLIMIISCVLTDIRNIYLT